MEIRSLALNEAEIEIEDREDGSASLRGYASVFYDPELAGTQFTLSPGIVERIDKHAFDRALKDGDDVVGLVNHNLDRALSRTSAGSLRLDVDKKGLRYSMDVAATQTGKDAIREVKSGLLRGSSFAFHVERAHWTEEAGLDVRTIKQVRLVDVGPVLFPAYSATSVQASRHNGNGADWETEWKSWKEDERQKAEADRETFARRMRLAELG